MDASVSSFCCFCKIYTKTPADLKDHLKEHFDRTQRFCDTCDGEDRSDVGPACRTCRLSKLVTSPAEWEDIADWIETYAEARFKPCPDGVLECPSCERFMAEDESIRRRLCENSATFVPSRAALHISSHLKYHMFACRLCDKVKTTQKGNFVTHLKRKHQKTSNNVTK